MLGPEGAHAALGVAVGLHHHRRSRRRGPLGVDELVGEQRDDHERHAGGQRAERRSRPAVGDDKGGVGEHVGLRHPRFDVSVLRDGPECVDVDTSADGEQDTRVKSGDRVKRGPVDGGGVRQPARDAAEGHIHEWRVAAIPAVGERGARGSGGSRNRSVAG